MGPATKSAEMQIQMLYNFAQLKRLAIDFTGFVPESFSNLTLSQLELLVLVPNYIDAQSRNLSQNSFKALENLDIKTLKFNPSSTMQIYAMNRDPGSRSVMFEPGAFSRIRSLKVCKVMPVMMF